VPSFVGSSREQVAAFADGVQERIATVDSDSVCGWIIDLRDNPGGNVWPMLAGIGPLLGEGVVSSYVYPDGRNAGVAVIVGPRTASSGELVAISFIGRANSRTFGSETLGLTTNNDSFPLEDGSILVLATSVMADRTGQTYGGSIQPETVVASELSEAPIDEKAVIEAASQWLQDQPTCRQ
jgi:C-terminal processing protease CtpA/Prc